MSRTDPLPPRVRDLETTLLDCHYKRAPLLRRGQVIAVSHLLKIYGNLVRDFQSAVVGGLPRDGWQTELELCTAALEQALRWTLSDCGVDQVHGDDTWSVVDGEAESLLAWARLYVKLTIDHTTGSRGLYQASVDETRREVRFHFKQHTDGVVLTSQRASWHIHFAAKQRMLPESALGQMFERWKGQVDLAKLNPEDLPPLEPLHHCDEMKEVVRWSQAAILPELSDGEDLSGFSLGQFRLFWSHLYVDCEMVTRLETFVDDTVGPENELGSVVWQDESAAFATYLANMYAMDTQAVESMIECLTFRAGSQKSALLAHPFIKTTDGTVSLLCRRVVTLDPDIMLSMALARHSRRSTYEHLINAIEQRNTKDIGDGFRSAGFDVLTQASFTAPDGAKICPDFLIYEQATRRLLVVDYKHALPPWRAGEVANKLRDLDDWNGQVRRYLQFICEHPSVIASKIGPKAGGFSEVDGSLLFRWPMAVPGLLQTDVAYADWPSLAVGLREVAGIAISHILTFYRLPRNVQQTLQRWRVDEERVVVGDWTYIRPIFVGDSEKPSRESNSTADDGRAVDDYPNDHLA